jgi:ABC-type polysaccharide/polyol phosphate export permease
VILMILMYLTPILYPISILSLKMQTIVNLNPLTSYLDIFRWAFSNNAQPTLGNWIYMILTSILTFALKSLVIIILKNASPPFHYNNINLFFITLSIC